MRGLPEKETYPRAHEVSLLDVLHVGSTLAQPAFQRNFTLHQKKEEEVQAGAL